MSIASANVGTSQGRRLARHSGDKRWAIASGLDREAIQAGPLAALVEFVEPATAPGLANCVPTVAIAVSEAGAADMGDILATLAGLRSVPRPPLLCLNGSAGPEASVIAALLEGPLARLAAYASGLNAQLLDIKREREELFENFRALEDAFNAQSMAPVSCVFEHTPYRDAHDEGIATLLAEYEVTQLLPVASSGISGFALHFGNVRKSGATLTVRLELVEDDAIVGEWPAASEAVVEGWNYFALPKALSVAARSLRIRLRATDASAPEPSMGYFLPLGGFAAQAEVPHRDLDHRPLAFRLYAGIPGVRPAEVLGMHSVVATNAATTVSAFRLPQPTLEAVKNIAPVGAEIDFPLVQYLAHDDAVVCHPQLHGPTVAMLQEALPACTEWVHARVQIRHPEGMPAFAAMIAADASLPPEELLAALPPTSVRRPAPGFSGWFEVRSGEEPLALHLALPEDAATRPHHLLMVSMPAAERITRSWLHFRELRAARRLRRGG